MLRYNQDVVLATRVHRRTYKPSIKSEFSVFVITQMEGYSYPPAKSPAQCNICYPSVHVITCMEKLTVNASSCTYVWPRSTSLVTPPPCMTVKNFYTDWSLGHLQWSHFTVACPGESSSPPKCLHRKFSHRASPNYMYNSVDQMNR